MGTTVMGQRVESPERWQRALQRAMDANLIYIELIGGDGAWAVSSQRDCELGYVATTGTCTCEAGRSGDPVCCHRALVRVLVGMLPLDPEPTSALIPPALSDVVDCPDCHGCGVHYSRELERLGLLYPSCVACAGSGIAADRPIAA